jgi:DnaJ-domain-containing protein 1
LKDHFALLQQPRRPWLEPDTVQSKFLALSALVHPDRVHNESPEVKSQANQQFAQLNAACQCLRDPRLRLRHLLELEGAGDVQQLERLPSAAMDFYFQLGQVCQSVDRFLATKPGSASPLLQAQFFQSALEWSERIQGFQSTLQDRRAEIESQLRALNALWETAPEIGNPERKRTLPFQRLEQLYRELSYVGRWSDQVRERLVQLSI